MDDALDAFAAYAPSYTRQPREEAWRAQRAMWGELLKRCGQCDARIEARIATNEATDADATDVGTRENSAVKRRASPIVRADVEDAFVNATLARALPLDARRAVIDALVASGDARWLDDASTRARVVDARDLAALDDALTTRVEEHGLSGKVCTMDELASALGTDRERARAVAERRRDARPPGCAIFGDDGVKFA